MQQTATQTCAVRNIENPDERRTSEHGSMSAVSLPGVTVARAVFQPGWKWSTDVKPIAATASCDLRHAGYIISGRFHIRMDDGQELDLGPGDAHVVSPGHDAWVIGDQPCVILDFAPADDAPGDPITTAAAERQRTVGARSGRPDDTAAIRAVIEAYADRMRSADVPGVADLFTRDAAVMAPNLPTVVGRDQLTEVYRGALGSVGMDFRFEFDEAIVLGETAIVRSRTTGKNTVLATGEEMPASYRELFVLQNGVDRWRIARYMFQPQPDQS